MRIREFREAKGSKVSQESKKAIEQHTSDANGELKHFSAGTVIFSERETGGSLHFVKTGKVEIYQKREGSEVVLATLGPGEVLGTMSLLTKEKRLASARAKTNVTTLYIDTVNVDELIESVPFWVKTVIRDFVLRIQNINSQYCALKLAHQMQRSHANSRLLLARQCANGLSILSHYVSQQGRQLNLNECLSQLAAIIQCPLNDLRDIITVFEDSGLIANKAGAPPILGKDAIEALRIFSQFAQANAAQSYSSELLERILLMSERISPKRQQQNHSDYVEIDKDQLGIADQDLGELMTIPYLELNFSADSNKVSMNSRALGALLSSFLIVDTLSSQNQQENTQKDHIAA